MRFGLALVFPGIQRDAAPPPSYPPSFFFCSFSLVVGKILFGCSFFFFSFFWLRIVFCVSISGPVTDSVGSPCRTFPQQPSAAWLESSMKMPPPPPPRRSVPVDQHLPGSWCNIGSAPSSCRAKGRGPAGPGIPSVNLAQAFEALHVFLLDRIASTWFFLGSVKFSQNAARPYRFSNFDERYSSLFPFSLWVSGCLDYKPFGPPTRFAVSQVSTVKWAIN